MANLTDIERRFRGDSAIPQSTMNIPPPPKPFGAVLPTSHVTAPMPPVQPPRVLDVPSDKDRAVIIARVLLRAPNIDSRSDLAVLAQQFLRVVGLSA